MTTAVQGRILLADDEPLFLRTTAELFRRAGFECLTAVDALSAVRQLNEQAIDAMVVDLNMPGNLELELLDIGRRDYPQIPMIVVTGSPSLHSAISSIRLQIADYLLKPVKFADLEASVRRALAARTSAAEGMSTESIETESGIGSLLLGNSPQILAVQDLIRRAAASDVSVLITGESGTGKELAAQSLHQASRRRNAPFVTIDCTAIPESLFESVLFGHAKGAFTGAISNQTGLLKTADGGTVFLDEIGELPLTSQAKLLRLIQHGTFTPVGNTETISINVRFIAATNRNLEDEVRMSRFRQDLFYRLAVVPLVMPPLRERGDDVLFLANRFLRRVTLASDQRELSTSAIQYLRTYSWPGNVRELKNVIDRAAVLSTGNMIELIGTMSSGMSPVTQGALPVEIDRGNSREQALIQADRGYLEALLRSNAGNVSQAAQNAGLTRQGLYKLLEKYGISPGDFRS